MQEKLNLVKSLHLIKRQLELMVFSEHLQQVGIHYHIQLSHSFSSLGICGMLVELSSKIFGVVYLLVLNH
jgi:hypothetical protein